MTTEELIKRLKKEQVNVKLRELVSGLQAIDIFTEDGDLALRVFSNAMNWLEVAYLNPNMLNLEFTSSTREHISIVIGEYLDTPLEERKPEKKYYLRLLHRGAFREIKYIRDVMYTDTSLQLRLSNKPVAFTERQLEAFKYNSPAFADSIDAMKEEVKDDD